MGPGRVTRAAVDAGPLIHLSEIGRPSLLELFEAIHIPDAVWGETVERHRVPALDLSNLHRHTLPAEEVAHFTRESLPERLHLGERECLYLCRRLGLPLVLTDDLAVRDAAKRLGVQPVGSLGIVVKGAVRMLGQPCIRVIRGPAVGREARGEEESPEGGPPLPAGPDRERTALLRPGARNEALEQAFVVVEAGGHRFRHLA